MTQLSSSAGNISVGPTGLPALSPIDVYAGHPFGLGPAVTFDRPPVDDPLEALRAALRPALERTPCLIAFSGGRDSSLLLALAADLAAREGLPAPVAITHRYPGDEPATESSWQELVMDALRRRGLPVDWECRDPGVDVDVIGPLATALLRKHRAPLFPAVVGPDMLLTSAATGGALVTGDYGDEVLGGHRAVLLRSVWRRRGRQMSTSTWSAVARAAPLGPVRAHLIRTRPIDAPWLRPAVQEEVRALRASEALRQPFASDASVRMVLRYRAVVLSAATFRGIASINRCHLFAPLGDPAFVDALARVGGRFGRLSRADAMRLLAGDLLPPGVHTRAQKAYFNRSRFGSATRAFAMTWNHAGIDPDLVDPEALRTEWLSDEPSIATAMLLQQAWLATHGVAA